jgi:hypothetical protein
MKCCKFLLILLVSFFTGCVHVADYPEEWGNLDISRNVWCASIDGTYDALRTPQEEGEDDDQFDADAYLTNYLLPPDIGKSLAYEGTTAVQVTHRDVGDESQLLIRVLRLGDVIYEAAIDEGKDFTCIEDGIKMAAIWDDGGGAGVSYVSRSRLMFRKNDNGDLIGSASGGGFIWFLVAPLPVYGYGYARWPAVQDGTEWRVRQLKKHIHKYCTVADNGNAGAQKRIGDIYKTDYFDGTDIAGKDLVRAYIWYRLSHEGGDDTAGDNLALVESQLSADQLTQAKQMVAEWQPGDCQKDLLEKVSTVAE